MSIDCVPSNISSDVRCDFCGQGFLVFAGREANQKRNQTRALIQDTLRMHHHSDCGHPASNFTVEASFTGAGETAHA